MSMNCRARFRQRHFSPGLARIAISAGNCGLLAQAFQLLSYAPVALRFQTYSVELPPVAAKYALDILELPALKEWLSAAESETESIPEFDSPA